MNRTRDRKSRFGPPSAPGNTRMSNFAASNQQEFGNNYKTPEQIAFGKKLFKIAKRIFNSMLFDYRQRIQEVGGEF
jgi:hypothetical protein